MRLSPTSPARLAATLALAMGLTAPLAGAARADAEVYDFYLRGIRAGSLTLDGTVAEGRYQAKGRLESGGLLGLVKTIRYDARAEGMSDGKSFTPSRYTEKADTGKRKSESVMEYQGGVPQVKQYNPPRKKKDKGLDPATQGGTVDPLTAAFAALRDVPAAQACRLNLPMFDGQRRSQVVIGNPQPQSDGTLSCAGEYRRVDGFDADEMAERSRFPFTVVYEPAAGGLMRVRDITMATIYGNGSLKRR